MKNFLADILVGLLAIGLFGALVALLLEFGYLFATYGSVRGVTGSACLLFTAWVVGVLTRATFPRK